MCARMGNHVERREHSGDASMAPKWNMATCRKRLPTPLCAASITQDSPATESQGQTEHSQSTKRHMRVACRRDVRHCTQEGLGDRAVERPRSGPCMYAYAGVCIPPWVLAG